MAFEDTVDLIKGSLSHTDDDGIVPDVDNTDAIQPSTPEEDNGEPPAEDGNEVDGDVVPEEPAEPVEPAEPETPPVEPAKEPAKEPEKPKADEEDELAGIKSHDAKGRENRIPYSAVVRINKNAVAKAEKTWKATHDVELGKRDEVIKQQADQLNAVQYVEKTMFGEHGKFLGMLIQGIPGYRELLGNVVELDAQGNVVGVKAAGPAQPTIDANDPEPRPDVDLGNGQIGYSPEQHLKLREWDRRQAEKRAVAAAEAALDKRYKPVLDAFTTHQTRTAKQREEAAARESAIAEAKTWPGWEENADAVLKALQDDYKSQESKPIAERKYQFSDIRSAYLHVLHTKAHAIVETQAQMEARIRKEEQERLRRAPRSTNAGAGISGAGIERDQPAVEGAKTTADLVRASIKR